MRVVKALSSWEYLIKNVVTDERKEIHVQRLEFTAAHDTSIT
jgi:hypothetical protein